MWASLNLGNGFPAPALISSSSPKGSDFEDAFVRANKVLRGADEGTQVNSIDPSIFPRLLMGFFCSSKRGLEQYHFAKLSNGFAASPAFDELICSGATISNNTSGDNRGCMFDDPGHYYMIKVNLLAYPTLQRRSESPGQSTELLDGSFDLGIGVAVTHLRVLDGGAVVVSSSSSVLDGMLYFNDTGLLVALEHKPASVKSTRVQILDDLRDQPLCCSNSFAFYGIGPDALVLEVLEHHDRQAMPLQSSVFLD